MRISERDLLRRNEVSVAIDSGFPVEMPHVRCGLVVDVGRNESGAPIESGFRSRRFEKEENPSLYSSLRRIEIRNCSSWVGGPQPLDVFGQRPNPLGLKEAELAINLLGLAVRSRMVTSRPVVHGLSLSAYGLKA